MTLKTRILAGTSTIVLASAAYLAFLGVWEGAGNNIVYPDRLAGNLPTVCKGITRHTSPFPVVLGDYWSPEKCEQVEALVATRGQLNLAGCITNETITQGTFEALSSHAHNFGVADTCASRALGLINAGRVKDGCNALAHAPNGKPVWSYVKQPDGSYKFIRGLYNRRLAEVKLCLSGLR